MPANPDFINEEPAEAMILDGLDFVLTTTRSTPGKGNRHDFIYDDAAVV